MPEPVIKKIRGLYEVLLRFEGPVLKGAHVKYLECITEDDVVTSAREGHAMPLSLADAADIPTLKATLGDATYALLTAKEAAEADAAAARAAAEERVKVAEAKEAEAVAKVESVAGLLATQEQLDAKDATAQALLAQVADLEAALAAKG